MKKRHKWNGKVGTSRDDLVVACINCGMVKQTITGFVTYFINDTVYHKTSDVNNGNCDNRLNNNNKWK